MRRRNPPTNSPTALRLRAMPTRDNAKRLELVGAKTASNRTTEGKTMREYVQGQRIRVKTNLETEFPVRRVEYTFVHQDAPGERITVPADVASPPDGGKLEVILDGEVPQGQAPGEYRLESVRAYPADAGEPMEAITEEIRNEAEFRLVLRSDKPPRASGWEYDPE
jgi:hypothetical protein